jgi:hypothetical protein
VLKVVAFNGRSENFYISYVYGSYLSNKASPLCAYLTHFFRVYVPLIVENKHSSLVGQSCTVRARIKLEGNFIL